nr:hypothetical protein [Tanacetum cinerariifolium]
SDSGVRGPSASTGDPGRAGRSCVDADSDRAEERADQAVRQVVRNGRRGPRVPHRCAEIGCSSCAGAQDRCPWSAVHPRRRAARHHVRNPVANR